MTEQRAIDAYNKEARFRMMVQSVVAFAMNERGPVDPDRADADAHDIATLAAVTLLQRIYDEDAELSALRQHNAVLTKMVEELSIFSPPKVLLAPNFGKEPTP